MAKGRKFRFGVIGPGGAGRHRTLLLNRERAIDVVAAADIDPACLDKLEAGLGHTVARFRGPGGYRKMLETVELDAVGVFTPHTLHYEHALAALDRGLHVLIEKPMVCGVGNAIRTAKLAARKRRHYLIHYQRHFEAKYVTARRLVARGAIGEIRTFYVYMAQDWRGGRWRGQPKYSGGGQLNDSGSHYQDILLYMTGLLPISVRGSYDCHYHGERRPIEINGSFSVELSNGAAGRLIIIGDYIRGFTDDVRLLGTKGMIRFDGAELILQKHGRDPVKVPVKVPRGYPANPCDNFARLLTGRTSQNHVPALFGAQVALLTDGMLAAGRTGRKVACKALLKRAGYTYRDLKL